MRFNHTYPFTREDIYMSWWTREMCRDLKDYLLSLSFDGSYSPVVYFVGDVGDGKRAEVIAQELPFFAVHTISQWNEKNGQAVENMFDERVKFYNNIIKDKGTPQEYLDEIYSPAMVFIDSCKEPSCLQEDFNFWLPRMRHGAIVAGNHYLLKTFKNHKVAFETRKVIVDTFLDEPHKVYPDGGWYRIL